MNRASRTNTTNRNGDGLYSSGRIDEVSLYVTALPASRVTAHYNAGLSG